jgi:co-chaperonin GroES (HSP10)
MPRSQEQIKHDPVTSEVWRNNRTGVMWFDPRKIKPLGDHILVELDDDPPASTVLMAPQTAARDIGTRTGTVLAAGPGKWREKRNWEESFILNPLIFAPTELRPGDRVMIGHYSDWESWHCGADGHESRGRNIVLCQEADARLVMPVALAAHA